MSDSELSEVSTTPVPPDSELEQSLRREVVKAQRAGLEDPTVNSIRAASEEKLGLMPGFYKSHNIWVVRSKQIIKDQFVSLHISMRCSQALISILYHLGYSGRDPEFSTSTFKVCKAEEAHLRRKRTVAEEEEEGRN